MLHVTPSEVGGSAQLLAGLEELPEGQGVEAAVDAGGLSPGCKGAAQAGAGVQVTKSLAVGLRRHMKCGVCGWLALGTRHLQE